MKRTLKLILWLLAAIIVIWAILVIRSGESPLSRLKHQLSSTFIPQQTIWADTPILESIREMKQFVTASYYEELPKVDTKVRQWPITNDAIVIIYNVTIEAGFDLSQLTNDDVKIYGDTAITVHLPAPGILTRKCNPSDKTIFHDSDKWSQDELSKMHQQALNEVEHNAKSGGIMTNAINNGREYMTRLLCSFGFKEENIHLYIRN